MPAYGKNIQLETINGYPPLLNQPFKQLTIVNDATSVATTTIPVGCTDVTATIQPPSSASDVQTITFNMDDETFDFAKHTLDCSVQYTDLPPNDIEVMYVSFVASQAWQFVVARQCTDKTAAISKNIIVTARIRPKTTV